MMLKKYLHTGLFSHYLGNAPLEVGIRQRPGELFTDNALPVDEERRRYPRIVSAGYRPVRVEQYRERQLIYPGHVSHVLRVGVFRDADCDEGQFRILILIINADHVRNLILAVFSGRAPEVKKNRPPAVLAE